MPYKYVVGLMLVAVALSSLAATWAASSAERGMRVTAAVPCIVNEICSVPIVADRIPASGLAGLTARVQARGRGVQYDSVVPVAEAFVQGLDPITGRQFKYSLVNLAPKWTEPTEALFVVNFVAVRPGLFSVTVYEGADSEVELAVDLNGDRVEWSGQRSWVWVTTDGS